eukprot:gnl/MRDRNA2_/MRDRNA2_62038_c0_seq1.p1 gnl/MRDRNA2_/MRDRNA2_62038_c0~~gnl/MRDRNA2_/MRDRNA2_62038_c0_seq1.p1  ORF type:complete len:245 (-),score=38.50 gnl/MRDRNA2_/MRDRNA2_62038_c0_seq1:232-966(-)
MLRVSSRLTAGQVKLQLALILEQKPESLALHLGDRILGELDSLSALEGEFRCGDTPELHLGWMQGHEGKVKQKKKKRDKSPTSTDFEEFTEIRKFSWADNGETVKIYVDEPAEALMPGTEVCVDMKKFSCSLSVRNPEGQIFVLTLHPLYGPINPNKSKYKFSEGKRITITFVKPGPVQKLEGRNYYDHWVQLTRDDGRFMDQFGMTPSHWGDPRRSTNENVVPFLAMSPEQSNENEKEIVIMA